MDHNPQKQEPSAPNMEVGDSIVRLNECGHFYCRDCITHWLTENSTCPMCQRVILDPVPLAERRAVVPQFYWRMRRSVYILRLYGFLGNDTQCHDDSDVRNVFAFINEMTSDEVVPSQLVMAICHRIAGQPSLFDREELTRWLTAWSSRRGRDEQRHEQDGQDLAEFSEMLLNFELRRATATSLGVQST